MNHFKFIKIGITCAALAATTQAFAFSRPYDAVVGAVIKDGAPCFYSIAPLRGRPHFYSDGVGIELMVENLTPPVSGFMWHVWFKSWKKALPESPATCVPYGMRSPDKNPQLPKTLPLDTPLTFSSLGEWGRQAVNFCIRKDGQGQLYLSQVAHHYGFETCKDEVLKNDTSRYGSN